MWDSTLWQGTAEQHTRAVAGNNCKHQSYMYSPAKGKPLLHTSTKEVTPQIKNINALHSSSNKQVSRHRATQQDDVTSPMFRCQLAVRHGAAANLTICMLSYRNRADNTDHVRAEWKDIIYILTYFVRTRPYNVCYPRKLYTIRIGRSWGSL